MNCQSDFLSSLSNQQLLPRQQLISDTGFRQVHRQAIGSSQDSISTICYIGHVMMEMDAYFMKVALEEARLAEAEGEVPIGAVVVLGGDILGRAGNRVVGQNDPTGHAEMVALRQAALRIGNYRLEGCTLYVTIEPCAMCAGAAVLSRVARLVYGADDPKNGAVRTLFRIADDSRLNHRIEVTRGVLEEECSACLRTFFQKKRSAAQLSADIESVER